MKEQTGFIETILIFSLKAVGFVILAGLTIVLLNVIFWLFENGLSGVWKVIVNIISAIWNGAGSA